MLPFYYSPFLACSSSFYLFSPAYPSFQAFLSLFPPSLLLFPSIFLYYSLNWLSIGNIYIYIPVYIPKNFYCLLYTLNTALELRVLKATELNITSNPSVQCEQLGQGLTPHPQPQVCTPLCSAASWLYGPGKSPDPRFTCFLPVKWEHENSITSVGLS